MNALTWLRSNVPLLAATLFWLYYFLVQKLPVTSDEAYFAHIFWLLGRGCRQYVDFYSNHLPLYFHLISPLLPNRGVEFVWWLRGLSFAVLGIYAAMLRPALWPYMLMFALFGRMVEIRPDTFGLLLFNAAWWLLLRNRSNALPAAALAGLALLFSARAAVMMVPMAGLCLYFEWRRPWPLIALGIAFVAAVAVGYLAEPSWFLLMIKSVFIDTLGFEHVPMAVRFFHADRLVLVVMITAALACAISKLGKSDAALITAVATAAQLVLIVVDPSPFEYVYGWAMVPVVMGLPGGPTAKRLAPLAFAALIVAAALVYPAWKGREPRAGSLMVLTLERPIDARSVSTPALVGQLLDRHDLWNQLAVRTELCRRIQGRVIVYFWYQPICLHDALYDWIGLTWPKGYATLRDLPPLIVWGQRTVARPPDAMLAGYDVYPAGFALLRTQPGFSARPHTRETSPAPAVASPLTVSAADRPSTRKPQARTLSKAAHQPPRTGFAAAARAAPGLQARRRA